MKKGVHVIFYIIVILAVVVVLSFIIKPQEQAAETTRTKLSICGNGVCDRGESSSNCCSDCACAADERCNDISQRCETFALTKSDAEDAVRQYIGNSDYRVLAHSVITNGKMLVYAYGTDTRIFLVDKNSEVEEIMLEPE
jgi:hypothetical protein